MSTEDTQEGLRARKRREVRRRISDTATRLFLERGFDAVSVEEIARAAEVSKATVFNYFDCKEDLLLDRAPELAEYVRRAMEAAQPARAMEALRDALIELVIKGDALSGAIPEVKWYWPLATSTPGLRARAQYHGEAFQAELAGLLKAARFRQGCGDDRGHGGGGVVAGVAAGGGGSAGGAGPGARAAGAAGHGGARFRRIGARVPAEARTAVRASPRGRLPLARNQTRSVVISGVSSNACACFWESQLPIRRPMDLALFTRWMPAASSGARRLLSVASTASFRTADIRTMMDDDPSLRSSSDTRHALTVALVKPGRGSWAYQPKNSSRAML